MAVKISRLHICTLTCAAKFSLCMYVHKNGGNIQSQRRHLKLTNVNISPSKMQVLLFIPSVEAEAVHSEDPSSPSPPSPPPPPLLPPSVPVDTVPAVVSAAVDGVVVLSSCSSGWSVDEGTLVDVSAWAC